MRETGRRRILCKLVYVQDDGSTLLASDHLPLLAVFVVGELDVRQAKKCKVNSSNYNLSPKCCSSLIQAYLYK